MKTPIRAVVTALFVMLAALPASAISDTAVPVQEEIRTCEIVPSIVDDAGASIVEDEPSGFIRGVTLEVDLLSSYIDPDVGAPIYEKQVIHTTLAIDLPGNWYVGMFLSTGLDSDFPDDDYSDEIDWIVGKVWELPFGMELDTSVAWCDSQAFFTSQNDVLWAQARLNIAEWEAATVKIRPYAYVTGLWTFGSSEYEGGTVGGVGFEGEIPLYSDVLRLTFDFMIGYDDGVYGYQPGALTKSFAGIEWDVTERVTLRAGGTVWSPLEGERETTMFGSIGVIVTF